MITEERIKEIMSHVFGVPSISSVPSYVEVQELCGMALQFSTLTAKVKRYEDALISIRDINCFIYNLGKNHFESQSFFF